MNRRLLAFVAASAALLAASIALGQTTRQAPATQPAFEQRAVIDPGALAAAPLARAQGGPAVGLRDPDLEPVALIYGPQPTVIAADFEGERIFMAFPRWGDPVNSTVAVLGADGELRPFPDAETNRFLPEDPRQFDPREHLVSVQSVVLGADGTLWLLDTGSINLQPPIDGGPKLWGYDPATGERTNRIDFTIGDAVKEKTYLNDVRFDPTRGDAGMAYITDSGVGGLIVVDLATGESWRKLDGHPSVTPQDIQMTVEGQPFDAKIASDGLAISPDHATVYYTPLTGRTVYAVDAAALADRDADAAATVREVATKPSANDGIFCGPDGAIYTTDFEDNAIRRVDPETGAVSVVVQDERILWPDCVIVGNGAILFTSNQLHRQPKFHGGDDRRVMPFVVFGYPAR